MSATASPSPRAALLVRLERQPPQDALQVHVAPVGLQEQLAQVRCLFLGTARLDLLPAPQQDVHRLLVEQRAGVGQPALVRVHQRHHGQQQRVRRQPPQVGPA